MNEQQFDLTIRADGYDSNALHKLSVIGDRESDLIDRLQSSAPLLLEGIRGTGKTTLLKLAAEGTNQNLASGRLAAYVSFSRYLLLENPRIPIGPTHPFILWVCTKILSEVWSTASAVTGMRPNIPALAPLLEARFENIIGQLELTYKLNKVEESPIAALPKSTQDVLASFSNPDSLRTALVDMLSAFHLTSLNLLCDEAAQYFKPEFQPLFFSILKAIHSPSISFKAAIYPTLTYFGADFELGNDASIVPISRACLSQEWMTLCKRITEKRSNRTDLWDTNPVIFESLAFASFGIPRRFIELVGSIDPSASSELDVQYTIKTHAQRELLQPFEAVKARIPALVRDVELASHLLTVFISDLKLENTVRTYRTGYVAVSKHRALPFAIRKALNLLVYFGVLERQPSAKLGHSRETADRLLLNPALIYSENILADATKKRLSLKETNDRLKQLELDKFKEYGRNSKALQEAVEESRTVASKPCPQCGTELPIEARFCTNCGSPQAEIGILPQLLSLASSELNLTPGILAIVTAKFLTVGDVFAASDAEIDALPQIGPVRTAIVRHAVDEFISG